MAMLSNGNARQLSTIFPNLSFPRTQHHGTWFWQEQVHTVRRPPQVPQYTYACQTTKTPYKIEAVHKLHYAVEVGGWLVKA